MIYKNKIALITGSASGGLGQTIAENLAKEGAAGIVITGRSSRGRDVAVNAIKQYGAEVLFIEADLSRPEDCNRLIETTDKHFGRVDGLVNSAGITDRGTIEDTTVEMWDSHMAVNLRAPFLLMQGCIKIMQREKIAGSIINIGSTSAYGGQPFLTPYSTSKGALVILTKNAAFSQLKHRIRVNAILPGWMDTPGEHAVQKKFHNAPDDWLEKAEAQVPMGKLAQPDELAKLVTLILSDQGGVMTGAVIDYDQKAVGAFD
jgi:NAD(P)-dependent dehydrogenase (short-subunit alcohol dehydrogenase family)